jgi:pyrrolidone-carboxylate peptidase
VRPLVCVTGFGPFENRGRNPSREVAAALRRRPPRGVRVAARELPVSFERAPLAVAAFVAEHAGERPALLLGLGVQPAAYFCFERRARGRYDATRRDNDGATGAAIDLGGDLAASADVARLAELLRAAGARDVRLSDDAGGYVCERTMRALLEEGARIGVPAAFLHVPPIRAVGVEEQARVIRAMLAHALEERA